MWILITSTVTAGVNMVKSTWAGQQLNGFELWRQMFRMNEGGAEQTQIAEITNFMNFPAQ